MIGVANVWSQMLPLTRTCRDDCIWMVSDELRMVAIEGEVDFFHLPFPSIGAL